MAATALRHRVVSSADGWTADFGERFLRFYSGIFVKAFPNPDLRESAGRMRRLADPRGFGRADPWGFVNLIELREGHAWRLAGGICYEWYRSGSGVLVTYIAVGRPFRRRGLTRLLFASALERLRRETGHSPGAALPVFAETEMPHPGETEVERELARARLNMLARLGFRILDFDYIQPPLSSGKSAVSGLRLLCYVPSPALHAVCMPSARIEAFLSAFYKGLLGPGYMENVAVAPVLQALLRRKEIAALPLISHNADWAQEAGGGDERGSPLAE